MRTSSTHRRLAAALAASGLALVFSLGTPAFGGEQSRAAEHRNNGGSDATVRPASAPEDDDSVADTAPADADADNRHPSGKDRHEDNGAQGHSNSTPDQDGHGPERNYGGTDKSYEIGADGLGGMDTEDQDGNNGCGNDDDFEDDNEGWCGKPESAGPEVLGGGEETKTCPEGTSMPAGGTAPKDCKAPEVIVTTHGNPVVLGTTDVLASSTVTDTAPGAVLAADLQAAPAHETAVLGISLERAPEAAVAAGGATAPGASVLGAALARTGLSFTLLAVAIAFGLLAVGFGLRRAGRTTSA